MSEPTYKGSCFCGSVEIKATGAPAKMGYCHCEAVSYTHLTLPTILLV